PFEILVRVARLEVAGLLHPHLQVVQVLERLLDLGRDGAAPASLLRRKLIETGRERADEGWDQVLRPERAFGDRSTGLARLKVGHEVPPSPSKEVRLLLQSKRFGLRGDENDANALDTGRGLRLVGRACDLQQGRRGRLREWGGGDRGLHLARLRLRG